MKTKDAKKQLEKAKIDATFIGNGKKVIAANVKEGTEIFTSQKVIILTDQPTVPNMKGWSERDVLSLADLLDIKIDVKGNGYVTKQSVDKGKKIKKDTTLEVQLNVPKNKDDE